MRNTKRNQILRKLGAPFPALILGVVVSIFLNATCLTNSVHAQSTNAREYKLKVAYLYNFAKFVTWPAEAFSTKDAPLVIGILGTDPFGTMLDSLAASKKANDRSVVIKRFAKIEQYEQCHILFVSGDQQDEVHSQIVKNTEGAPTLVIGETRDFAKQGGTVEFFHDSDGTIGFSINIDAVKRQNLIVQATVLKLARIVHDNTTLTSVKK